MFFFLTDFFNFLFVNFNLNPPVGKHGPKNWGMSIPITNPAVRFALKTEANFKNLPDMKSWTKTRIFGNGSPFSIHNLRHLGGFNMILLIFIGKIAYNDFVVSIFDYKFVFQLGGSVTPDTPDYRGPGGEDVTATGGMDFISAPTSGGASWWGGLVNKCIDSWESKGLRVPQCQPLQEIWSS